MVTLSRMLTLLAGCLFVFVTTGQRAHAQGDALRFFQQNQSRGLFSFGSAPKAEPPRVTRPARRPRSEDREYVAPRRRNPAPAVAILTPDKPVIPPTIFIHVIGDSLSELLAQGLKENLVDKPEIGVVRHSRSSSGLVRDDFHDWPKVLRDISAGPGKIDLLVMMIGSNDRQSLRDEAGAHEFRSDAWREIYVKRIDEITSIAKEKLIPLIWVGMPVMQASRISADMLYLNGLYKERAARNGATFVDTWEGFANDQGQFASSGPDVNGEIVKLRTADGIHFTKAGARKLGFFVAKETEPQLTAKGAVTEIAALPADISEQIKRDSPGLVPTSLQSALFLPEELLRLPVISERPLQGAVFVLTAAPQTSGAQLLRSRPVQTSNEMTILVEQVMGYGRMPIAKTGRADDFRWEQGPTGVNRIQ